jgi:HAD superfamily hydrolase (TIGR01549 family)
VTLRAVFFDVFGTLMPYKNIPREIIVSKRAQLAGLSLTPEQVKAGLDILAHQEKEFAMAGQLGRDDVAHDRTYWEIQFTNVLHASGVQGEVLSYATAMCDAFLQTEDFYLDDETLPTLRGLKQRGFLVGVISNAPKGLAKTLDKYGLLSELVIAVGSQDIGLEKPNARIFQYALHEVGVQAGESAYVGDEYMTDAKAAAAAGMMGIFLDRNGHRPLTDLPRIRRLSDLLADDSPLNGKH